MKVVQSSPAFTPAFTSPPGEPIVAVDENHQPVIFAVHLSGTPEQIRSQLGRFTATTLAHSKEIGKIATAMSAGLDVAAYEYPQFNHGASEATSFLAFFATGVGLADAAKRKDPHDIKVSAFKFGLNGLDLLVKSGVLGAFGNHLQPAVMVGKFVVSTIDAVPPTVELTPGAEPEELARKR